MRYLRTFLKRWYLYIIPIIVLPAVLTAYGYNHLVSYTSQALIYVDKPVFYSPGDWNPYISPAQNVSQYINQLLQSPTFVAGVAARTLLVNHLDLSTQYGKDTAFTLITSEVSVEPTFAGPNTMLVSATDTNPVLAQQIVQGLLDAFTHYYQSNQQSMDNTASGYYTQQLQAAESQLNQDTLKLQEYLRQNPQCAPPATCTDPTVGGLQQQVSQDQAAVNDWKSRLAAVQQDEQAASSADAQLLQIMDPPQVPMRAGVSKKKLLEYYTGGGLGIALGLVGLIVALLTQLDRKVYSIEDLRTIEEDLELDLPTVDALPLIAEIKRGRTHNGASEDDTFDGILLPVLTALPRLHPQHMQRELWRAAGGATTAYRTLSGAETPGDGDGL
jgi:uncharacterized protein involved in exopolysaccharide biosynthesis